MSISLAISTYSMSQLQMMYNELWKYRMFKDIVLREIANYCNPDMADWYIRSDPQNSGRSPNTGIKLYDWTAIESSRKCAEGLMGYAISRESVWFRVESEEDEDNNANPGFFQKSERQMYKQLQVSPFYDETRIFLSSLLDFATAIMRRHENAKIGRPSYKTLHLNRSYIANDEWGDVDVLFYDIWMSAQNMVAEYTYDACPPQVQDAFNHNKQMQWLSISFLFPRKKYDLDFEAPSGEYIEITTPVCDWYHPMRIEVHQRKPFFAARYMRSYDSGPWGLGSPGMLQLGNIKMANAINQDMLRIGQRMADPPIVATLGARGRISRVPGDISYMTPGNSYKREEVQGDPRMLEQRYLAVEKNIRAAYHEDFFLVLTNNIEAITKSTATGVQGLQGEKAAMLSAFSSRLGYEFLEPLLQDLWYTEYASGRLGIAPKNLRGKKMKLNFVGPLWQMQRQQLILNATMSALQQIGALAQMQLAAGMPGDVLDNFDLSAYARDIAVSYDVAKDVLRNTAQVLLIRRARAQVAQQQANLQQKEDLSRIQLNRARSVATVAEKTGNQALPGTGAAQALATSSGGQGLAQPQAAPVGSTLG